MKINLINNVGNNNLIKYHTAKTSQGTNPECGKNISADSFAYPKNYYLSFQRKSLEEILKTSKDDIPLTVRNYIDSQKFVQSEEEFEKFKEQGIFSIQMQAFENLRHCKTVADIKAAFPEEPYFKDLKELKDISIKDSSLFGLLRNLQEQGVQIMESDTDITTFIVRKIFLECKMYKDVFQELCDALTDEAKQGKVGELLENANKSNSQIYLPLGIKTPNGRVYGASVKFCNPDYVPVRKSIYDIDAKGTNERIERFLRSKEPQQSYTMKDAWNQCKDIREALSEFLTQCMNESDPYNLKIQQNSDLTVYDADMYSKLSDIMVAFWEKYPEYKKKLSEEIQTAIARYNSIAASGEDALKKHMESIDKTSAQIRKEIQANKKNQILKYEDTKNLLSIAVKGANIFEFASNSVVQDCTNLLFSQLSQEDKQTLEGDSNTDEFNRLVPIGILRTLRETRGTEEYRKISYANYIALLKGVLNSNLSAEEKDEIIKEAQTSLSGAAKKITTEPVSQAINFEQVETDYNRYKVSLSETQIVAIAQKLMNGSGAEFAPEEQPSLEALIREQGRYAKLITGGSKLKQLVELLVLKEYDKIYGTEHAQEAAKTIGIDIIAEDALNTIDNIDLSGLLTW